MKTVASLLICSMLLSLPASAVPEGLCAAPAAGIALSGQTPQDWEQPELQQQLNTVGYIGGMPSEEFCEEYNAKLESAALGQEIADYALQFVGGKYRWGGTDPKTGFDCSGLVYYTYLQFGYSLNRIAEDQALNGVHVDEEDMQPGDVLCFYTSGDYIGHVGIYLGNREYVHAQCAATGVVVSNLDDPFLPRTFEARRIV